MIGKMKCFMTRFYKIFAGIVVFFTPLIALADTITVFAAASLKAPIDEIARAYEQRTGERVVVSYASSAALARQIEFGAPADVYLSAHPFWVERLQGKELFIGQVSEFAGNSLVVAARGEAALPAINLTVPALLDAANHDPIAVPFPTAVPLGIYAKQAFTSLGLWNGLSGHIVETDSALSTRRLLEQGQVSLAVLYMSDIIQNTDLQSVAAIPSDAHDPVHYQAGAITPLGQAFVEGLTRDMAQQIFTTHGFLIP